MHNVLLLFFSHLPDKIPDRNDLRRKGFKLAHNIRGYDPSWWERHGEFMW